MINMEIDNSNCNHATYSRVRDQNNNNGLLICSNDRHLTTGPPNLHLMNSSEQNLHQMNLNHSHHLSSHCHLQTNNQQGSAYNVCPSMHNNQQIAHLHAQQQDISSGQSDIDSQSTPSPDATYKFKLSPSQNEQIYKREVIDSDNY